MTSLLTKLFIKNPEDVSNPKVRHAYGTMVSIVGIIINILLFVGKFAVGTLFSSIAITADGINNLSDAGSSIVSLVSFKISARPADRDHPFGHARIEYIASMVVSFLILLIGYQLLRDSIDKIIHPVQTEFSVLMIVVLSVSILVKLWLGLFYHGIGKKIDSGVIRASATDSLSDVLSTTAVLISMLILRFTGFDADAYMGIVVAVIIFIAGIKILRETKDSILGEAPSDEIVADIKRIVSEYPEALGIHDLIVHNYGPGQTIASLHVEVDGATDIFISHDIIDNIEKRMHEELGILCTIHLDPIVTNDERVNALRAEVLAKVREIDDRLAIHDFRFVSGTTHTNIIFDVVMPFEMKMKESDLSELISEKIKEIDQSYNAVITIDRG